jgi:hypothetical protein
LSKNELFRAQIFLAGITILIGSRFIKMQLEKEEATKVYDERKKAYKKIVDSWWTHEDIFMDFQTELDKLKVLASQCPYSFQEKYGIKLLEIEELLRNDCLID